MTDKIKLAKSHIEDARMQIIKAQSELTGVLEQKDVQDAFIKLQLAFERLGSAMKAMESDAE